MRENRKKHKKDDQLKNKLDKLYQELEETKSTLLAIQKGSVDAFIVTNKNKNKVITLTGSDEPYYRLIESLNEGTATVTQDGTILFCNKRLSTMLKKPTSKIIGASIYSFIEETEFSKLNNILKKIKGKNVARQEFMLQVNKKNKLPVELSIHDLSLKEKTNVYMIIVMDISERKKAEKDLLEREELYRRLFELSPEGIIIVSQRKVVIANQTFLDMVGAKNSKAVINRSLFAFIRPDYKEIENERIKLLIQKDSHHVQRLEEKWLQLNGKELDVIVTAVPYNYNSKKAIQIIVQDITQYKKTAKQLSYLSSHDPLTGLHNELWLKNHFDQILSTASENKNHLIIYLLTIDNFKEIIATQGTYFSELLLQLVAKRIKAIAGKDDIVVRLGADEFVIILTELFETDYTQFAVRLLDSLKESFLIQGKKIIITGCVGISTAPEHGKNYQMLLKSAENALYEAKKLGRNSYKVYSKLHHKLMSSRISLETDLREAFLANKLFLVYQPKLELKTGRVYGVEALIRWQREDGSMVSPMVLIELAESMDIIIPMGEWILRSACKQQKEWMKQGLSLQMAVNISAKQFQNLHFEKSVKKILNELDMDPANLELEITETALIQQVEHTRSILSSLKEYGVQIAIDDFGTGYSSLNYLKFFTIDTLKIDQSFINDIGLDVHSEAIILAVIAMGHSLGFKIIAEGVKNKAQLEFLKLHQCDEIQGFYLSKGLMPGKIISFCKKKYKYKA